MIDPTEKTMPIPMRLLCPECGQLHVDAGDFATKPHHTHSCQHCGLTWRPAVVPTVGVRFLPGFLDEQHAAQSAPPRLTEKPFFEGLAEHQKQRVECPHGVGLRTASCPSKAAAPGELLPKRQAPLVMIGPDRTVESEPPAPEAGEERLLLTQLRATTCGIKGCWLMSSHDGDCSVGDSDYALSNVVAYAFTYGHTVRASAALNELWRRAYANREAALSSHAKLTAALARVEQLRTDYVKLTESLRGDAAHKEIRRLEEELAHEIIRHGNAELGRHAAWSSSKSAEQARDEALAKVEVLDKKLSQVLASCETWREYAAEFADKQKLTKDEALIVAWSEGLIAGQHTLGLNEDELMPQNPYTDATPKTKRELIAIDGLQSALTAATSRAEAAEGRLKELTARLRPGLREIRDALLSAEGWHAARVTVDSLIALLPVVPTEPPLATAERPWCETCGRRDAPHRHGSDPSMYVDDPALDAPLSWPVMCPSVIGGGTLVCELRYAHDGAHRRDEHRWVSDPPAPQELGSEGEA